MAFINSEKIRKLVHLVVGLLLYLITFSLQKDILLLVILAGSAFAFITFRHPLFRTLHQSREGSLGTLFYPLGVLAAYLILYSESILFFRVSLLVLSVSDTIAYLAGQLKTGNIKFRLLDQKSLFGMMAYALCSLIIFIIFLPDKYTLDIHLMLFLMLLTVAAEGISSQGSDNLSIPLVLALFFLILQESDPDFVKLSLMFLVFSAGAILFFRFHLLSRRASIMAWLLGLHLLGVMGWQWFLPVILFFTTSIFFTKIHSAADSNPKPPSGRRNLWQVAANSLWALISTIGFLFTQNEIFIHLFIVFVASVTADTWASEAGPLINKKAFSLSEMRMRKAGVSGGISAGGTMIAIVGAAILSALSYYWFFGKWNLLFISLITLAAFTGTLADSLLGAFAEDKLNKMPVFQHYQYPEAITPNDIVNLGGSLTAGLVLLLLL